MRAITIGLTGGIGSGKSAAAAMLAELGAVVIDADKVGHGVYEPGTACWHDVVEAFGREIVASDGTIDRKRLGARVFSEPSALDKLNALVQPRIAERIAERIRALREQGVVTPIIVEAAVLIEAGWQSLVDEIWVLTAARERAIERVMATRGLARSEVERRIDSQLSNAARAREAACVIANDGTLAELRAAIERCWSKCVGTRGEAP